MRIGHLRHEIQNQRATVAATVVWEDCGRGTKEVFFETSADFADGLATDLDAFLVASLLPAMRHGERRVKIEGEICPDLKVGLTTAMSLFHFWYGDARKPLEIEAKTRLTNCPKVPRSAFFFTGGIDSLATLRVNRLHYGEQHPGYFRDGLLIFGLEVDRLDSFQCVLDVLRPLAQDAAITTVPVYTNVRSLEDDWIFWIDEFEAAVLSSVAHALNRRISSASIGSSFDYPYLHPHASHPLLDPNYSSWEVQIRHDGVALSRLAKTRLLAGWPAALQSLRVCNLSDDYRPGVVNCGRCEKCLRTLTALLVVDKLDSTGAFAHREVTPELIRAHAGLSKTSYPFWDELIEPLRQKGRDDLALAVMNAVAKYRGETGWKGYIKRFDRLHLNGSLLTLKRTLRDRPQTSPSQAH